MGYKRNMIHRMAEELSRIAYSDDPEQMDEEDVFTILDAIFYMNPDAAGDELSSLAAGIFQCQHGGMYEVFQELPDILDLMEQAIAKHRGYDSLTDYLCYQCDLERLKDKDGKYTDVYVQR